MVSICPLKKQKLLLIIGVFFMVDHEILLKPFSTSSSVIRKSNHTQDLLIMVLIQSRLILLNNRGFRKQRCGDIKSNVAEMAALKKKFLRVGKNISYVIWEEISG